jgi:hypothetical protein
MCTERTTAMHSDEAAELAPVNGRICGIQYGGKRIAVCLLQVRFGFGSNLSYRRRTDNSRNDESINSIDVDPPRHLQSLQVS